MIKRPLIGLTLDAEPAGGWSKYPWYALRQNYCEAVAAAGGLAVALPHEAGLAEAYLDRLDGLIVTGGAFDVDPALYGDAERHETVALKSDRTSAEMALLQGALARGMPVLGICGGQQLLAVALGGTLIQHIPDSVPDALAHEQKTSHYEPGHDVEILARHAAARHRRQNPDGGEYLAPPGGEGAGAEHRECGGPGRGDRRDRGGRTRNSASACSGTRNIWWMRAIRRYFRR